MHIAIDARIINSSTGRYVERLLYYLQEVDALNVYTVLVREKDKDFWTPRGDNFNVRVADFDNYSLAEQIGFKHFLNRLKPDLVHFCMPQQPVGYKGKKVTTFHDLTLLKTYNSDKNWLVYHVKQAAGSYVFRYVARTNDHIIAISKFTRQELLEFTTISADKVSVIYEAAETNLMKSTKYKQPYKQFILYVGQQSDYKNIKRLGDAHQRLLEKYPDLGLVLVGNKNTSVQKNEAYFTEKKYLNILFTGFVSDAELGDLYSRASAYIFPSLMEGFGLPGLEAMVQGVPVVSSNATCLPEVYGNAAHYFDPLDVTDMTKAIDEVLSDEKRRVRLVNNGFKQIKKYSWKKMAEQTHQVYMNALKEK